MACGQYVFFILAEKIPFIADQCKQLAFGSRTVAPRGPAGPAGPKEPLSPCDIEQI